MYGKPCTSFVFYLISLEVGDFKIYKTTEMKALKKSVTSNLWQLRIIHLSNLKKREKMRENERKNEYDVEKLKNVKKMFFLIYKG